jgi:hypothetical protein
MNIIRQMSAKFAGVVGVAGFMCSMAVAGAALATDKTMESAIKPCAWWTFEKGMETDRMGQPPFPRPPVFAAYFAEATKAKKATTGRPVRPNGSFRGLPQKANY